MHIRRMFEKADIESSKADMEKENIGFNKSEHWKGVNAIRKNAQNKSAYWYITKFGSSI